MTRIAIAVSLLPMVGCGSRTTLSATEARHTFEALNRVTTDLVVQSFETMIGGSKAKLDIEANGNDYGLSGTLSESHWEGDITVEGEVTSDRNELGYTITLAFDEVRMEDGPTLDGDVGFEFWAQDNIDPASLNWKAGIGVDGDLAVSGRDSGAATLGYDVTLEVDGPVLSIDGKGDISGHDVSDWGQVLSFVF
jgi:hypothetical protein